MQNRVRLIARSLERRIVPSVYIVDEPSTLSDGNYGIGALSFREAIQLANTNQGMDTIVFDPSIFSSATTLKVATVINIGDSVIVQSPPVPLSLDGESASAIISISNSQGGLIVELNGLTFLNGSGSSGSAILVDSNADVTISDCNFINNKSTTLGSAITAGGPLAKTTLNSSVFMGNTSQSGGAVFLRGLASINACTFSKNISSFEGGAIYAKDADLTVSTSTFDQNSSVLGGAIAVHSSKLSILDSTISKNSATGSGGGVWMATTVGPPTIQMTGTTLLDNKSESRGGGLYLQGPGTIDLQQCLVSGNQADIGGGIYAWQLSSMFLSISKSTLTSNSSVNGPGAIGIVTTQNTSVSTLNVADCEISKNTGSLGGGLMTRGNVNATLSRNSFTENVGTSGGGGVHCRTVLGDPATVMSITDCSLSANKGINGGGVFATGSVDLTVRNTTISGNEASGRGGGFCFYGFGNTLAKATITNNTIVFNKSTGPSSGGIYLTTSSTRPMLIESCLIAKNIHATSPDYSGPQLKGSNNLIGVATGITFADPATQKIGSLAAPLDPLIDSVLAANGSANGTKTHALQIGSPAFDNGLNTASLDNDQRGISFGRTKGNSTDIGAYEAQIPLTAVIQVNDGSAQRSMVTSMTVYFNDAAVFPSGYSAGIQLQRNGPGGPNGFVNLDFLQLGNSIQIRFNDLEYAPGASKSLVDGTYVLTLFANHIHGISGPLDGDGNGTSGGDLVLNLHRLFGDATGDGSVNSSDFAIFRSVFGTSSGLEFDANGDGVINAVDFAEFRARFGITLSP